MMPALALLSGFEGMTTADLPSGPADDPITGIGTLVWMLVLVAVIVLAGYYLTRLLSRRMTAGGASGGLMRVVDRLAVAQNKAILMVSVGERLFMIGVTASQLTLLGEMQLDELPELPVHAPPVSDRLASFLAGVIKRRGGAPKDGGVSFSEQLRRSSRDYGYEDENTDDKDGTAR